MIEKKAAISAALWDKDVNVLVFESLSSTNDTAKAMAIEGAKDKTLIVATRQELGRGRLGRSFYSALDGGIYLSLLLRPRLSIQSALLATTAAAVAVCRALADFGQTEAQIKWVNDIFLHDKKICGILAEASHDFEKNQPHYLILGIGVNAYGADLPQGLSMMAGSAWETLPTGVTLEGLTAQIVNRFLEIYPVLEEKSYLEEYKSRSLLTGKTVILDEKSYQVLGISPDAALVLQAENGEIRHLEYGEVSLGSHAILEKQGSDG